MQRRDCKAGCLIEAWQQNWQLITEVWSSSQSIMLSNDVDDNAKICNSCVVSILEPVVTFSIRSSKSQYNSKLRTIDCIADPARQIDCELLISRPLHPHRGTRTPRST